MFRRIEILMVTVATLYMSGAILPMLISEEYPVNTNTMSDWRLLALQVVIYSSFFVVLAMLAWENRPVAFPPFWLSAFIFWMIISVGWSADPVRSAKKLATELASLAFGVYLGNRFSSEEEAELLLRVLSVCAVLSLIVAAVYPGWAFMREGALAGDLRGVFAQKNGLGRLMVLLVACTIFLWRVNRFKSRITPILILTLATGTLLLTKSATSLILLLLMVALIPFFYLIRMKPAPLLIGGVLGTSALAAVVFFAISNATRVLRILGKKADLTGRTELWSHLITMISKHPWNGYGIHGFWLGMNGPSSAIIEAVGWQAEHAHNGALEITIDLGIVGLALFLLVLLNALMRGIRIYRRSNSDREVWPLVMLTIFAAGNVSESFVFNQELLWILFIAAVCRISSGASTRQEMDATVATAFSETIKHRAGAEILEA